jgi:hypothetical protein
MANAMATNRPHYRVDNQGYSVNTTQEADESQEAGTRDTKIAMPTSQPPMYSAAMEKFGPDKKVKVGKHTFFNILISFIVAMAHFVAYTLQRRQSFVVAWKINKAKFSSTRRRRSRCIISNEIVV